MRGLSPHSPICVGCCLSGTGLRKRADRGRIQAANGNLLSAIYRAEACRSAAGLEEGISTDGLHPNDMGFKLLAPVRDGEFVIYRSSFVILRKRTEESFHR